LASTFKTGDNCPAISVSMQEAYQDHTLNNDTLGLMACYCKRKVSQDPKNLLMNFTKINATDTI